MSQSVLRVSRVSGRRRFLRAAATACAVVALAAMADAALAESDDPITFALVSPLSEPGDVRSGEAIRKTAELWVEQTNEEGGIDGRQVELAIYDTQGQPEVGASAARRAITERDTSALFGMWSSSVVLAMMEQAHRYGVPMFTFYTWSDDVTLKNYPEVFRTGPYNSQIAADTAPYLIDKGYERVTVLAEDTDYGIGFAEALDRALEGSGIELDIVQFQAQAQDLTPQLSRIASESPDALSIQTVYAASNLSIAQAREVGYEGDIIAGWDWPELGDFWPTVGEAGVGVVYPTFFDESLELTETGSKWRELYRETYDDNPAIFQLFLIDNFEVAKAAIEQAGSADPAALVETIPTIETEGTTGQISFQREEGTVHFNQWEEFTMFFKQMTEEGQDIGETVFAVQ